MRQRRLRHRRVLRGFSMIELLVAVLVMGIGVLGISALQMVSLQNNRGALYRAEAVQLAYDMMDRIKAHGNPAAYDGLAMAADPPAVATDCTAGDCTPAQLVTFDQAVWKCLLGVEHDNCDDLRDDQVIPTAIAQPGLPRGDGSVAVTAGGVITVTVQWRDEAGDVSVSITGRG